MAQLEPYKEYDENAIYMYYGAAFLGLTAGKKYSIHYLSEVSGLSERKLAYRLRESNLTVEAYQLVDGRTKSRFDKEIVPPTLEQQWLARPLVRQQ